MLAHNQNASIQTLSQNSPNPRANQMQHCHTIPRQTNSAMHTWHMKFNGSSYFVALILGRHASGSHSKRTTNLQMVQALLRKRKNTKRGNTNAWDMESKGSHISKTSLNPSTQAKLPKPWPMAQQTIEPVAQQTTHWATAPDPWPNQCELPNARA